MSPYLCSTRILFFIIFGLCYSCSNPTPVSLASNVNIDSAKTGAAIFDKNCKLCHGVDGRLGLNGAKDLSLSTLITSERINIITNGKNLMTPFGQLLSPSEIDSVASFTFQLR